MLLFFSKSLFHLSFEPACRSSSFSGGIMQKRRVKRSKTCVDHAKKTREAKQDMC